MDIGMVVRHWGVPSKSTVGSFQEFKPIFRANALTFGQRLKTMKQE